MSRTWCKILLLALVMGMLPVFPTLAQPAAQPAQALAPNDATVYILHTNDFHGHLEYQSGSSSNPGMARVATVINNQRTALGAENVVLMDAGDMMQGSLLSNLNDGEPVIDLYNFVGYGAATFGNHEFDWGQTVLADRVSEASFPFVTSNIVNNDTGNCATAGWTSPAWASPWITMTVGAPGNQVTLGVLGVTTQETPYITIAEATAGLCFKDPASSIIHHYDAVQAAGAEAIIVLSHIGHYDGGLGYGFTFYGDRTLATMLEQAGKKADLIIGGHSHTNLATAHVTAGGTTVVQAYYSGRRVGRAAITVTDGGAVSVAWQPLTVSTGETPHAATQAEIDVWVNDPAYQALINQVIGYSNVDLIRNYNGDSLMGKFIQDAIYYDLNTDAEPLNDVDMVFNNPGGIRVDLTDPTKPFTLTYGMMYSVLPFGNATVVGDMTGSQILELLNQSATLFKGAIQVGGIRYSFYSYTDTLPGPQPWAWGAYDVTVWDQDADEWEPLVMTETYRVATNEFLAPAGQDGFVPFKYMTNISYWGDMLDGVNRWVSANYSTTLTAYNESLDGRITQNGTGAGGDVIPVTILHHNDSHGNLAKGSNRGYTQLATLINQERAHNPTRNLLVNAGDQIQGDSMMYYYKSAFTGYAVDGTALPPTMTINPMMAVMNAMTYTAMTLGNHEFNFGNYVFTGTLGQANFPLLQANVYDDGRYGLAEVGVRPYVTTTLPGPSGDIEVAVLGIGNHRVPKYELPSNIVGLTFTNPITEAAARAPSLKAENDVLVALTHIGFTVNPASVEVDDNVDTYLAANVSGIDTIIGGHSHTDPASGFGPYKFLPTIVGGPDNTPVTINHALRYNNTLGQVVIGLLPEVGGGYEVVAQAGRYHSVTTSSPPEDARIKAIVTPYVDLLTAYNNTTIGQTTVPIDALQAYTQETNGANLQADASVWELADQGITVDFHLSGAMSNRKVADTATPANPYTMTVADVFTLMPYENSLVVMQMNGPQIKAILERGYRNYYYYKYVPGQGGYSYYTTCMLDINSVGQITYYDSYPRLPNGHNVASLVVDGVAVDFADATTYYDVSTVNYLAAGSCNFNDAGETLWPLDQIIHDTQYYVRDAVIHYTTDMGTISPAIEGRLQFKYLTEVAYLPAVLK